MAAELVVTHVEVRIVGPRNHPVLAFADVTLNEGLLVKDVKVVDTGTQITVAYPSRPWMTLCPYCRERVGVRRGKRMRYCSSCGREQSRLPRNNVRNFDLLVNPIAPEARAAIEDAVLDAFHEAMARSIRRARGGAA